MTSICSIIHNTYAILLVPLRNSILELLHLIGENLKPIARYLGVTLLSFALISSLGYFHLALRYLTWILLGVASSIGFGFGMHTFVLFLAPHIAAVTMAAHSCRSLDFPEPPYPNEILCPERVGTEPITFLDILQKIGIESFMWGLGTAIGELPPYLAARLRAQAIGRRAAGDHPGSIGTETAGWELWMIKIINKVGFVGILLCAAIPNPLFDAAGVASGIAQIPFLSFFGATLIGKAVIKVLLQSSFVILSFHNKNLDSLIERLSMKFEELLPSFKDLKLNKKFIDFLDEQRNNVLTRRSGESKQASLISKLFNSIICVCFVLFFMSLVNALDKQYRERRSKTVRRTE